MKKKICLSFAVICSMSLFATSALADGAAQTCGYDFQRSKDLKQKGDDRADKAKTLVQKMMADANTSLEDVGKPEVL